MSIFKPLFAVAVALSLVACSATSVRRSFKESIRDSKIKAAVRVKLTKDKVVKARHMEVDVWRGVVTLHGRALSAEERVKAEELTRGVKRVVAVENHLQVINDAVAVRTVTPPQQVPLTTVVSPASPVVTPTPVTPVGSVVATRGATAVAKRPSNVPVKEAVATKSAATKSAATKQAASKPAATTTPPVSVNDIRPSSAVAMPLVPTTQPGASQPPKVPAGAPAPMARKANGGKTLPWYGEVPDDEAPPIKPSKEISERTASAVKTPLSVDEDLAREAAEELKRLKGSSPH